MKRFTKTLALALAGLGAFSSLATESMACGGRGGGFGGGFGGPPGGHFAPPQACHTPFPGPPCARQPQFPPMNARVHKPDGFGNFQHPADFGYPGGFEQPGGFPAPGDFPQPEEFSQLGGGPALGGPQPPRTVQPQARPQQGASFQNVGVNPQLAGTSPQQGGFVPSGGGSAVGIAGGQPGVSQQQPGQPIAGQQIQGQQTPGQPLPVQPTQGQSIQSQPAPSQQGQGPAISGQQGPSQQAPIQQGSPPQQTQQTPVQPVSVGGSAGSAAPVANQPPGANPVANAQQSALDALGGSDELSTQVSAPVAQPSVPASQQTQAPGQHSLPTGEFTASPGNRSTIRLNLSENGAFTWTATFKGKTSTFQGTFSIAGTAFTLNRGNDNQKLEGSIALTANGFTLKLSGQNDNGLNFVRG